MDDLLSPSYRLPCLSKRITYGIGHVLNDLSRPLWLSYILLYMYKVVGLNHTYVGCMVIVGLVLAALAQPFITHVSDHTNGCFRYTKRKSWHLFGTVFVAISLPFLFMQCINCQDVVQWKQLIYYTVFMVVFQIGWTTTQTSHLALIPEITHNEAERVELNTVRYTFGILCGITTYSITWLMMTLADGPTIGPAYASWFRALVLTLLVTGLVCAVVFQVGTEEQSYDTYPDSLGLATVSCERLGPSDWLREPQFYQAVILYVFTSLAVSVSQMYLPIYLTDTLHLEKDYVAAVPLVAFLGAMIVPFVARPCGRYTSNKITTVIGLVLVAAAVAWMYYLQSSWSLYKLYIFVIAVLLGAGGAVAIVSELGLIAALVSDCSDGATFVFSTLSFLDKVVLGIAVMVIQRTNNCMLHDDSQCAESFYRDVLPFVGGGAVGLAFLCLLTLIPLNVGRLRCSRESTQQPESTRQPEAPVTDGVIFQVTPTDDCFNFWSCLGTSRETEAHMIVITGTSSVHRQDTGRPNALSDYAGSGVSTLGKHSYETLHSAPPQGTLRTSRSAPTIIDHSRHHHILQPSPEAARHVLSTHDKACLVDNEEEPEFTPREPPGLPGQPDSTKQVTVAVVEPTAAVTAGVNDKDEILGNEEERETYNSNSDEEVPVTDRNGN